MKIANNVLFLLVRIRYNVQHHNGDSHIVRWCLMLFAFHYILKSHLQIINMKGSNNMVEFGEQLRKAREAKGLTQQSLAEQLYVTRQTVSRWECGDRYPDLLTTKKISVILGISLDDLLSGEEMPKVVERTNIVENKLFNNIMIILYSVIVFSYLLRIADALLRFDYLSSGSYSNISDIAIYLVALAIQIGVFIYGMYYAVKNMLSPGRMGIVSASFFFTGCLTTAYQYTIIDNRWQTMLILIIVKIPILIGAVVSVLYFIGNKKTKALPWILVSVSACEIIRQIVSYAMTAIHSYDYLSLNTTLSVILNICIYILIIYQALVLRRKRALSRDSKE